MLINSSIRRYLTLFVLAATWLAVAMHSPALVLASTSCPYGSTQARVQQSITHDWTQQLTLQCQDSFRVGSFHDHTGAFANDTTLKVTHPNGVVDKLVWWKGNGETISADQNGIYTLQVTTIGWDGEACEQTATVVRNCDGVLPNPTIIPLPTIVPGPTPTPPSTPSPTPEPTQCQFGSTQARVQEDSKHDWRSSLQLNCGESFRVGGFHDNTGQFSNQVNLEVRATFDLPLTGEITYAKAVKNGDTIRSFVYPAEYVLQVTTPGQSGLACSDSAKVTVSCSSWFDWLRGWEQVI